MLDKLKALIAGAGSDQSARSGDERRHADLAAVALMIAVSNADHDVDARELQRILAIAAAHCEIADGDVQDFFNEAECRADSAISLYEFTDAVNQSYAKDEKYKLIENLWQVAFADGVLDRYEDSTIRKVAELIYVSHSDFIRAKHRVAEAQHKRSASNKPKP